MKKKDGDVILLQVTTIFCIAALGIMLWGKLEGLSVYPRCEDYGYTKGKVITMNNKSKILSIQCEVTNDKQQKRRS